MRKRPLCFLCIVLVVINIILLASGDVIESPDAFSLSEQNAHSFSTIYGEVYQCEHTKGQQILYLKQTVLSDQIPNYLLKKINRIKITCQQGDVYKIGDLISAYGKLNEISPPTNPGQFDSKSYYEGKKIRYTMWEPKITLVERPNVHLQRSLYEIRNYFSEIISNCMGTEEAYIEIGNIMQGIVLGNKENLSEETKIRYQIGGISHILAISAMHLSILGNAFYEILKRVGVSIHMAGVAVSVFLVLYGILTGASVATVRALIMFLMKIGAQLTGRTYDGKTSLSVAAVLLLAGNPLSLADSGFLLSFSAMISFALFRENRQLGSSILLFFFMMPVTLWLFYEISPYSILLNLFVVPSLVIVLISGVLACVLGSISVYMGQIAMIPGAFLLSVYGYLCECIKGLPYAKAVIGKPSLYAIVLYYSIMLLTLWLFRKYRLSWKRFGLYVLMFPAILVLVYHPNKKLRITALDVGQGDCIVVETPQNHVYIVDGGSSSVKNVGKYRIWPYLKYRGIQTIDAVLVTHPDTDHMNGILELLEEKKSQNITMKIKEIVLPKWEDTTPFQELVHLAKEINLPVTFMGEGDCIVDGQVRMKCLYPSGGDFSECFNVGSMVIEITYQKFCGLLTGDLEKQGEQDILSKIQDVDYLKVAHHGSRYSTQMEFLERTKPEISMISCGEKNFYGHPHEELLDRLEQMTSDIYVTKDYGAIWITTDGEKIDLHTFCKYNKS